MQATVRLRPIRDQLHTLRRCPFAPHSGTTYGCDPVYFILAGQVPFGSSGFVRGFPMLFFDVMEWVPCFGGLQFSGWFDVWFIK